MLDVLLLLILAKHFCEVFLWLSCVICIRDSFNFQKILTTHFCLDWEKAHVHLGKSETRTRLLLLLIIHFLRPRHDSSQALTLQPTSAHFLLISDVTPRVALGVVYILRPRPCSIFTGGLIELPQLASACCFRSFVSSGAGLCKNSTHTVNQTKTGMNVVCNAAILRANSTISKVGVKIFFFLVTRITNSWERSLYFSNYNHFVMSVIFVLKL